MSQSVSSCPQNFVVIGNPGDRRVELFQAALAGLQLPEARLVPYADLISRRVQLDKLITPASLVRIESPGRNFEVERALLALGAEVDDPEGNYTRLSKREVEALSFEKGRILPSRQWYLGYWQVLKQIARQIVPEQLFNLPDDICLMFDKRACHKLLDSKGIAVPPDLGPVHSYNELLALMQEKHWSQVFVKLAHGSSASGVVAYRRQGEHHQATTTVEMLREKQDMRLYNTRKIRVYRKQSQIAELIDALCAQRVQVERWLPKAGYQNSTFDIRVVTIGGKARHSIARLSAGPLTNLHLLNAREDIDKIRERLSEQIWTQAIEDCERAANLFRSLYTGVDLLFTVDMRHHAIVEMNAFGDLLPGLLYNGQDTYTAELVLAISQQWSKKAEIIGEGLPHA